MQNNALPVCLQRIDFTGRWRKYFIDENTKTFYLVDISKLHTPNGKHLEMLHLADG